MREEPFNRMFFLLKISGEGRGFPITVASDRSVLRSNPKGSRVHFGEWRKKRLEADSLTLDSPVSPFSGGKER
jgi:hypothetical protein